jgi:hypothetical protein
MSLRSGSREAAYASQEGAAEEWEANNGREPAEPEAKRRSLIIPILITPSATNNEQEQQQQHKTYNTPPLSFFANQLKRKHAGGYKDAYFETRVREDAYSGLFAPPRQSLSQDHWEDAFMVSPAHSPEHSPEDSPGSSPPPHGAASLLSPSFMSDES